MSVQINWKICDNDKACGGIEVCPTGALYWNEVDSKIGINNDLCTSCGICATDGCPVGAIIVTSSEEEYHQIQQEIFADPRSKEQLFVDRYGTVPISDDVLITKDDIVKKTEIGLTLIERFTDSSIECLLNSIIIDDIRYKTGLEFNYYKCEDNDDDETTEHPVLDIYINGELKGSISGYFSNDEFDEFLQQILSIINY